MVGDLGSSTVASRPKILQNNSKSAVDKNGSPKTGRKKYIIENMV
jgi:hypothetical protein